MKIKPYIRVFKEELYEEYTDVFETLIKKAISDYEINENDLYININTPKDIMIGLIKYGTQFNYNRYDADKVDSFSDKEIEKAMTVELNEVWGEYIISEFLKKNRDIELISKKSTIDYIVIPNKNLISIKISV